MKNVITVEQLNVLLKQRNDIRLIYSGRLFLIETAIDFVVDEFEVVEKISGYNVSIDNVESVVELANENELLSYLQKEKVILNNEAELVDIADRWKSYAEYCEHIEFCNISMEGLLAKYKDADSFSLTGRFNKGYSQEKPYGIYGIDEKTAKSALDKVKKWSYKNLRYYYDNFTKKEKELLPSFDQLIADIEKESSEYFALVESGNIPEGQSPFLNDLIYDGKTKYTVPQNMWHFYHEIYNGYIHYGKAISEMRKNKTARDIMYIFNNPYYCKLKESLHTTEVTFTWHCTTSSMLSVVYYFKIDKNSLEWLSMLKDDYEMKELEDLAFYKDGKVIFSSCTHEHFHNG